MKIDLKNRQHVLLLAVVLLGAFWLGDKLVVGPLLEAWRSRAAAIADLRTRIAKGQVSMGRLRRAQEDWERKRTNALPGVASTAEGALLRAFDRWSGDSRISVTSVKPQWRHPEDDYMTLECRVDAYGSLSALTRFLYEVEQDPLGVRIDALELGTRESDGSQLTLGLTVNGLYLNPPQQ